MTDKTIKNKEESRREWKVENRANDKREILKKEKNEGRKHESYSSVAFLKMNAAVFSVINGNKFK